MSDDEQNFKVVDRRPFNPDGTPREIPREEQPDEAAPRATPQPDERTARVIAGTGTERGRASQASSHAGDTAPRGAARQRPAPSVAPDDRDLPGADDPASFVNLIMSIASNAAAAMGMMPHPATGETGVELKSAKYWIDVLGMLEQKTRGNLHVQEQKVFESLLADLRMQYVSLAGAPSPSEKFTGSDITGGR